MEDIKVLLDKKDWTAPELAALLACRGEEEQLLFARSRAVRDATLGNGVYLRGLIELSNRCVKDCLYCGIRRSNVHAVRYALDGEEILGAAVFAHRYGYGSVVLQGGERQDEAFVAFIERMVREIKRIGDGALGITLSLGEQAEETYRRWREAGAHRYLLRIETSNESLYRQIHPRDARHDFRTRLECLHALRRCGYQVGTGVMIGLPGQSLEDLARDLFFLRGMDIDMVGMGPYLEHHETPLWERRGELLPQVERLRLGLHMVACLRLLMPDINIAATTALQAIDPEGRERALAIGANVLMPNITPLTNRANYQLYENKPGMDEGAAASTARLVESVRRSGCEVRLSAWGDSLHFAQRQGQP